MLKLSLYMYRIRPGTLPLYLWNMVWMPLENLNYQLYVSRKEKCIKKIAIVTEVNNTIILEQF